MKMRRKNAPHSCTTPAFQGEDLQIKMKNLASEMQSKSSLLSLALSLSTIVILVGIFGLVVVANHRQKKREQLKAILRAKNLGPVLESRKIANEVGSNFLPKYTQVAAGSSGGRRDRPKKKTKSFKPLLPAALTGPSRRAKTAAELAAIDGKFQSRLKKLDFNEFISGLMYRKVLASELSRASLPNNPKFAYLSG